MVTLVFGACVLAGLTRHLGAGEHGPAVAGDPDVVLATALRGMVGPA